MWVKLDDEFFDNPKVAGLSDKAQLLYVASLTYAAKHLTDGHLNDRGQRVVKALVGATDRAAKELVAVGLWECGQADYLIHDWAKYNPPAAQVRAEREAARQRMIRARSGERSGEQGSEQEPEQTSEVHPSPVPVPVSRNPLPRKPVSRTKAAAVDTPGKTDVAVLDNAAREEAPNVFTEYERAFGKPVPNEVTRQHLEADEQEFGFECVRHSLEQAALAGARTLAYAEVIMRRHKDEGCYTQSDGRLVVKRGPPATEWDAGRGDRYKAGKAADMAERTPEQVAAIEAKAAEINEMAERLQAEGAAERAAAEAGA